MSWFHPTVGIPASRRGQTFWFTLGTLVLVPSVFATLLRLFPSPVVALELASSFISFALPGYAIAFICLLTGLLRARRRLVPALLVGVSSLGLILHLAWTAPFFVPDDRPAAGPSFTIMSLNMLAGRADPAQVTARAENADIVVLLEVTPAAVTGLRQHGWQASFPYSVGDPTVDVSGTAIFSRFPLQQRQRIDTSFQQWVADVEVPGAGKITLFAVHPCNPYCSPTAFQTEHDIVRATAARYNHGPLLVAGDFNAVNDHGPMVKLYRDGLEDAGDITGAGWLPTYPAKGPIPPLIGIDHILVNDRLTATSIYTFPVDGTDHRGLMAKIARAR